MKHASHIKSHGSLNSQQATQRALRLKTAQPQGQTGGVLYQDALNATHLLFDCASTSLSLPFVGFCDTENCTSDLVLSKTLEAAQGKRNEPL